MNIYHYDAATGCLLGPGVAERNQLDSAAPLLPAYATTAPSPVTGERECARYLGSDGLVPSSWLDGEWVVHPDWRGVPLWNTTDGSPIKITEPNITPDHQCATPKPYPGRGYVWQDEKWHADPDLLHQLAEQMAADQRTQQLSVANQQIAIIAPAVEGGYAKPEHTQLLADWQRYRYELTQVPAQTGWPETPQWPTEPDKVI